MQAHMRCGGPFDMKLIYSSRQRGLRVRSSKVYLPRLRLSSSYEELKGCTYEYHTWLP
jgi:hypothetical protein